MSTTTVQQASVKRVKPPLSRTLKVKGNNLLVTVIILAAAVGIWQFIVSTFNVAQVTFPSPGLVWDALYSEFTTSGPAGFYENARSTIIETLVGFAGGLTVGVAMGIVVAKSRFIDRILYPFIIAFNALPKIALAPLLVLWFGFGLESKIVLVTSITFFPIMVAMVGGIKGVDPESVDLYRILGASNVQRFFGLELPSALPQLFTGIQVGAIFAILGAVVGEFVGAQSGLGLQLLNAVNNIATAAVFALLFIFAAFGLIITAIVKAVQNRLLFWSAPPPTVVGRSSLGIRLGALRPGPKKDQ